MDNVVCRFYISSTGCKFGQRCIFPHIISKYRKPDTICRFFIAGKCVFGPLCWYDHTLLPNSPEYELCNTWENHRAIENSSNCLPVSSGGINEESIYPIVTLNDIYQNSCGDASSSFCDGTAFCDNQYTLKNNCIAYGYDVLQLQNVYMPSERSCGHFDTEICSCDDETEHQANNDIVEKETTSESRARLYLLNDLNLFNNNDNFSEEKECEFMNEVIFDADFGIRQQNFNGIQFWNSNIEPEYIIDDTRNISNLDITTNYFDSDKYSIHMENHKCGYYENSSCYQAGYENVCYESNDRVCAENNSFYSTYTDLPEKTDKLESASRYDSRQKKQNYRHRSKAAENCSINYKEKSNCEVAWYNRNRKNLTKIYYATQFNEPKRRIRGSRSFYRRRQVDNICTNESLHCVKDSDEDKTDLSFSVNKENLSKNKTRFHSPANYISEVENIDTNSISSGIESLDLTEENISETQENKEFEIEFVPPDLKKCYLCRKNKVEKGKKIRMFGILEKCSHVFCLKCIYWWRSVWNCTKNTSNVSVSCPACETISKFIIPSKTWISSLKEKNEIIERYKMTLSRVYCKYYKGGKGYCSFGNSCLYRHAFSETEEHDI